MKVTDVYGSIYRKNYGWWSRFKDRWAGRRLARRSRLPLPEDRPLASFPFFSGMMHAEKSWFTSFLKTLKKLNDRLARQYKSCCIAIEKNAINQDAADEDAKVGGIEKERAQSTYVELGEQLGRPLHARMGRHTYVFILAVIALVEWPINWMAVQGVVDAAPWLAAIIALILGGVLVFSAHLLGLLVKRGLVVLKPADATGHSPRQTYITTALSALCFVLIATFMSYVIYNVGEIRQAFMDSLAANSGMNEGTFFSQQVPSILSGEVHVPLRRDGLLLIDLNAALLFIGATLSFISHDSVAAYDDAKKAVEQADRKCRAQAGRLKKLRSERAELDAERRDLERELRLARKEAIGRRDVRAQFVATRLGHFREGYEAVADAAAPQELAAPDIARIADEIADNDILEALFPAQWQPAATFEPFIVSEGLDDAA